MRKRRLGQGADDHDDLEVPMSFSRAKRATPWLLVLVAAALPACAQDAPPGVKQLLPRNAISSIDNPVFVSAQEAEIPNDAWVLGVVLGGQARAYSLNLLNHHEIVNDEVGDTPIAAVW
jgi:hypothetical protein